MADKRDFIELHGEGQTEEELSDSDILGMVRGRDDVATEEADSDHEDTGIVMNITHDQALEHARQLKQYMLHYVGEYGMGICHQLEESIQNMLKSSLKRKKQIDIATAFARA